MVAAAAAVGVRELGQGTLGSIHVWSLRALLSPSHPGAPLELPAYTDLYCCSAISETAVAAVRCHEA